MSFILAVSFILIHRSSSVEWHYNEPHNNVSHWADLYSECGGTHQSPIDIPVTGDTCDEPLILQWTSETVHFGLRNNGHSFQAVPFEMSLTAGSDLTRLEVLQHANATNIRLHNSFYHTYASAVHEDYYFDSLHFHWGVDSATGSEHTINGSHSPLEVHFVHFSSGYYTIGDALEAYTNGALSASDDQNVLAVIGVLFEIGDANPVLDQILNDVIINGVQHHDPDHPQENVIQMFYSEFDPIDLLPDNKEFIGYQGSLTTPPCYETVRWHVMKDRMTVSEAQMEQFRLLLASTNATHPIAPNWRPTLDIGDRTIYECNEGIESDIVEKESAYHHDDTHWGYSNASRWTQLYPECGGRYQSPIDISTEEDMEQCEDVLELEWSAAESVHFGVRNSGHSLQGVPFELSDLGGTDVTRLEVLHHTNDTNIRLQNPFYNTYTSAVNSEYCLDSFHFHWGTDSDYGSEHAMNGEHSPLEVHFVHYSCDYYMIGDALEAYAEDRLTELDDDHVLSVIGVLFEIGDANPALDKILSDVIVNGVRYYDPSSDVANVLQLFYTEFNPLDLLPQSKEFIGYSGSLTTPPCYETVRWQVMKERMTVSEEQMRQFRLLLESANVDEPIAPNWRPLQDVGNRTMYQCNDAVEAQSVEKEVVTQTDGIDSDDNGDNKDDWFIIGIVFICLFCVAVSIIALLSYMLFCTGGKEDTGDERGFPSGGAYTKAQTTDPTDIEVQTNVNAQ